MIKHILYISVFILVGTTTNGCQEATPSESNDQETSTKSETVKQASAQQKNTYKNIDVEEFMALLSKDENAVLLDVRTQEEIAQGKIENAVEMDFYGDNFQNQLKGLDTSKTYLVYCRSGSRSANTAEMLNNIGCNKVYNLKGGFVAYSKRK